MRKRTYRPHTWVGGDIVSCEVCGIAEYDFDWHTLSAPIVEWDCESVSRMNERRGNDNS